MGRVSRSQPVASARTSFCTSLQARGHQPFTRITAATIEAGRDRRRSTHPPRRETSSTPCEGCFVWALKAEHVKTDPTAWRSKTRRARRATGFIAWTEEHVEAYERQMAVSVHASACGSTCCSTRACVVAMPCALDASTSATALARSKPKRAASLSPSRCRSCRCSLRLLKAGPCGDLTLHRGRERQAAYQGEFFGNLFQHACKAAGVPGFGAWGAQDRRDARSEPRRDCGPARSDLWVDRRQHGLALHPVGGSQAARD